MASVKQDDELFQIRRIMSIVAAMHPSARRRVLQYVSDRVEMMTPFFPPARHVEAAKEADLLSEETA